MASLAGNLLVCYGRTIIPPSGSHWTQPSFSLKPYYKKPTSRSQTDGQKSYFRQWRIHATILSTETSTGEAVRPETYPGRYSIWGDKFSSFVWDNQIAEKYAKEIEPLKEEVRVLLSAEINNEFLEKLHLIDILERLGISYHFEKEIDENLENIFNFIHGFEEKNEYDLYNTALLFRILRQHGFDISSDIFKKFVDSNGIFEEEIISNDPKGLLSLYEASFLRRHEDDILEEALFFTKSCLQKMISELNSPLQMQISHALDLPLNRSFARVEAYYNINFYDKDESRDEKILKLAKLDFNLLQLLHKKELSILINWWKPIIAKYDYARDRLVECFFSALGQYFEPQYSKDRIMVAKGMCLISLIDDTFDAYGTLEELKLLTGAIERWSYDETHGHELPENMKLVYETILSLYQEYDEELRKQGRSFVLDYWKRSVQEVVKAEYKEATWILGGKIPSFEEYLQTSCITIGVPLLMPIFLFTSKCATKDTFEWLEGNPKLMVASALAERLADDIATYEDEKARGQLTSGIECYMAQYGVSKTEAIAKFHEMEKDAWKDMYGEVSRSSPIPMFVFRMALNYTCNVNIFFRNDINAYIHVEGRFKSEITALLVNPINV